MRLLLALATLLAFANVESAYSKYGRTCEDIGCLSNEECVMEEDACTLQSKGHCGTFPSCQRVKSKGRTCDNAVCPNTYTCQIINNQPRCVKNQNLSPRRKRQSYNPSYSTTDTPKSKYPELHETTPSTPTRSHRVTTERPNTYQIGYTQSAGNPSQRQPSESNPNQPRGYPSQGSSNRGYPTQSYPNQGYPTQGYPAQNYPTQGYPAQNYPTQGYPNQGYPSQGYPNQGYPNQGYPNQGYPSQGYPNKGYPNQGYPNQGYPSQGYPSQGYPNQGYPNQGYPNQGYPNQGYPNQGYSNPGYQNPGYQYPGYQNQGQHRPQGANQPGFLDPILNTLTKTVTQVGANYLRDKIFNSSPKQKPAQ